MGMEEYRDLILRDLAHAKAQFDQRPVHSVFFGGGTPSLMEPFVAGQILENIDQIFGLAHDAEVTLEANPSSVENARMQGFAAAGINRFSLGIQSLRDADLRKLGRAHDAKTALEAVALAQRHVGRVSIDLIYARHGQKFDDWMTELDEVLSLGLDHLSLYQLTIEPGTVYARLHREGRLALPDDEAGADMYEATLEACANAGLFAYEISNLAKPGFESRHNQTYWRYEPYLGVGPGAHGRPRLGGQIFETHHAAKPSDWALGTIQANCLSQDDELSERLVMGLRLWEGLDLSFLQKMGKQLDHAALSKSLPGGLIKEARHDYLQLSPQGRLVLEHLLPIIDGHITSS